MLLHVLTKLWGMLYSIRIWNIVPYSGRLKTEVWQCWISTFTYIHIVLSNSTKPKVAEWKGWAGKKGFNVPKHKAILLQWLSSHICVNRQGENPRIFQTVLLFTLWISSESPIDELYGSWSKGYQTSSAAVRDHFPMLETLLSHPPLFLYLYLYTIPLKISCAWFTNG